MAASAPRLLDLRALPRRGKNTGDHGLDSVSLGRVFWTEANKVTCRKHGAMNCVNPERTIWRCVSPVAERKDGSVVSLCGEAAYTPRE